MKPISVRLNALFTALTLLGGASPAASGRPGPMRVAGAPWRFSADIYGWLPNAPATIKIDGHEVAKIPESLDNILDSLEMAAMLRFDTRKGPLGFFLSPVYYKGDYDENFTGLLGRAGSSSSRKPSRWSTTGRLDRSRDGTTARVEPAQRGIHLCPRIQQQL